MSTMAPHEAVPQSSVSSMVREAASAAGRHAQSLFSLTRATPTERFVAPLLGLYLGWAVARVPEVFPAVAIPRLPMILMLLFLLILAVAVPPVGWTEAWRNSLPFRLTCTIGVVAVITVPLGIWMQGSLDFLRQRYIIAFVVFLSCFIFLRDRRSLRVAVTIFVICTASISTKVLLTWDPEALVENADGELVAISELRADHQRINISASLDPNDFGAVIATAVPLALWLGAGSFLRRIVWGGVALLLVGSMVPTASRGAMVGLCAVALTLVAFGATGWKRGFMLGLIAASALIFSAVATQGQLDRFLDFGTDDYNLTNEGRWFFWRQGFVWMIKRPWGYGIANYPTYFDWLNGRARAAHSSWVQYGMELGVAGITIFVLLVRSLWRGHKRNRALALGASNPDRKLAERESVLSGHMLAMMAGTLATGTFLSYAYYPLMYMMLGIAAATLLGSPFGPQGAGWDILRRPKLQEQITSPGPAHPPGSRGVTRLRRNR